MRPRTSGTEQLDYVRQLIALPKISADYTNEDLIPHYDYSMCSDGQQKWL